MVTVNAMGVVLAVIIAILSAVQFKFGQSGSLKEVPGNDCNCKKTKKPLEASPHAS